MHPSSCRGQTVICNWDKTPPFVEHYEISPIFSRLCFPQTSWDVLLFKTQYAICSTLIYLREDSLCFFHMFWMSGSGSFVALFTYVCREHSHGGYWQVQSRPQFTPHPARCLLMGWGDAGCSRGLGMGRRILIWERRCRLLRRSSMGRGGYRMIRESSMGREGCRKLEAFQRERGCRMFRKDNLPGQSCRLRVRSSVSKL